VNKTFGREILELSKTNTKLLLEKHNYAVWEILGTNNVLIEVFRERYGKILSPMMIKIEKPRRKLEWVILDYIIRSLKKGTPLIPFTLEHKSTMKLAEFLYRYRSRSEKSLWNYIRALRSFCEWTRKNPDQLIAECFNDDGSLNLKRIQKTAKILDEFLGEQEALGCTQHSLSTISAFIKTFYRVNDITLTLPGKYRIAVTYRGRAIKPEELQKLIEVADLREKAMIAMLATGGFRIGTLLKMKYRHVKEDLESGKVPVHIHIEAELNKGKVCDYDTFINEEAAYYLKLYLEQRRRGTEKLSPETITDESFLFITKRKRRSSLSYASFERSWKNLLTKLNLDKHVGRMREIRIHSLRKFFRTQLVALGVPTEYVEYMMGHKLSTYHDVQMKGIEFLRSIYATANLRIFPKPKTTLTDVLKEIIKARGEDPSKYLKEETIAGRTIISGKDEAEIYARAIWEMLRKEIVKSLNTIPEDKLKVLVKLWSSI